jgi:tRNA-splicing ligase RtcB
MAAAANYAWANRQCLMHGVRETFGRIWQQSPEKLGMHLVYDVAHNIAKFEEHQVNGHQRMLCIHRKGATRSWGPQQEGLPDKYQPMGQPVIIPGDMGTFSYVLAGTEQAMQETFGSTCHGAGRSMSRHQAIRQNRSRHLDRELAEQGILVRSRGRTTLQEECPEAYKDINEVVDVMEKTGISRKVARLRPVGVIKG